jgi:methylthioribose-1-phosphate isomerase
VGLKVFFFCCIINIPPAMTAGFSGNNLGMLVNGKQYRTIWTPAHKKWVNIIDQRFLPFRFVVEKIPSVSRMAAAIREMHVRGAPLIGASAAYGVYLAAREAAGKRLGDEFLEQSFGLLGATRPTAVNLRWALDLQREALAGAADIQGKCRRALETAELIADRDEQRCREIGLVGLPLIREIASRRNGRQARAEAGAARPLQVLTHCNAGALGCVDHGTATAPLYEAVRHGIPLHVWVDETRPRRQGRLTAWEMAAQGINHTIITDNSGGLLMRRGQVDLVIVGADRVAANGDTANKIGTYLKALAAYDNKIPFYVALPTTTFDRDIADGGKIPIEERDPDEVLYAEGLERGRLRRVRLFGPGSTAANHAFDITPARLITGFITEKGIFTPNELARALGQRPPLYKI